MLRKLLNKPIVLLLIVLAMLLTGCAASSQTSSAICPALPQMPAVSEPIPSQSYSDSVSSDIEAWEKLVTGTSPTR